MSVCTEQQEAIKDAGDSVDNPNVVGNYTHHRGAIETFTGDAFDIFHPTVQAVHLIDIAHALGMICRYNGHCTERYSVAEHSVHVANYLACTGWSNRVCLLGLLHDAAEAYIGDLCRPIKTMPELRPYRVVEEACQRVILEKFGLEETAEDAYRIKFADNVLTRAEAFELMSTKGEAWNWGDIPFVPRKFGFWSPTEACLRFLEAFYDLGGLNPEAIRMKASVKDQNDT